MSNKVDSIEQLLKPRYRVIGLYPESPFRVGEIVYFDSNNNVYRSEKIILENNFPSIWDCIKIFKPLEWWEERQLLEMPKYVKIDEDGCGLIKGTIIKPDLYGIYPDQGKNFGNENQPHIVTTIPEDTDTHDAGEEITIHCRNLLPATEAEYLNQNKKQ